MTWIISFSALKQNWLIHSISVSTREKRWHWSKSPLEQLHYLKFPCCYIDLEEVQSYELASAVPLALANTDGETNQEYFAEGTRNGTLLAYSLHQTAYIVDLLAIIQMLWTDENIWRAIWHNCKTIIAKFQFASQAHIAPDRYDVKNSIKSGERSRRSQWMTIEIKLQSRETKLLASLKHYLSSGKNKSNLLTFLLSDWCEKNLPWQLEDDQTLILASKNASAVKVTRQDNEKRRYNSFRPRGSRQ